MVDGERRTDSESRERIAVLETQMRSICEQLKTIKSSLDGIQSVLSEAKGGWKMLLMVGGAGGMVGAYVTKWASTLAQTLPK